MRLAQKRESRSNSDEYAINATVKKSDLKSNLIEDDTKLIVKKI